MSIVWPDQGVRCAPAPAGEPPAMQAAPATHAPQQPLIEVRNLGVRFRDGWGWRQAVEGVSFTLAPGQCVALVGESGSGKSVSARSLLGLHGPEARVSADRLRFRGQDLLGLRERQWRALRGRGIGYILQDALVSLDPLRTIGQELAEALRATGDVPRGQLRAESLRLLARAGFADAEPRLNDHPAQLSGGQRQRALIASAIAGNPPVLIADEPTTALDVSVQQQVLDLFAQLKRSGIALILISHDLGVVSQLADQVLILQRGRVVESGGALQVLRQPQRAYTRTLIDAVPRFTRDAGVVTSATSATAAIAATAPIGPPAPESPRPEALLRVTDIRKRFEGRGGAPAREVLHGVSLALHAGRTLGLVGESGSGKTTLARIVAGLESASGGQVEPGAALAQPRDWRARPVQFVYQDPLSAFDPRYTVGRVLGEALELRFGRERASVRQARVHEWLQRVGLDPALAARRPLTLSGGQRQRVAIARALAVQPQLVVMDEPVSALDVSVQKQVLALIAQLQRETDAAFLFISHDLGVVQQVSHDVAVMHQGRLVEQGDAASVLQRPSHPYTRALIDAVPVLGV